MSLDPMQVACTHSTMGHVFYHVLCPTQSLTTRVTKCGFVGLLLIGAVFATYSAISKYFSTPSIPKDPEIDQNLKSQDLGKEASSLTSNGITKSNGQPDAGVVESTTIFNKTAVPQQETGYQTHNTNQLRDPNLGKEAPSLTSNTITNSTGQPNAELVERARQSLNENSADFLLRYAGVYCLGIRGTKVDLDTKMKLFLKQQNRFNPMLSIGEDMKKCFREAKREADWGFFLHNLEIPNSKTMTRILTDIPPLCELLIKFAEEPLVDKWNELRKK
jgi:hypothetical protein